MVSKGAKVSQSKDLDCIPDDVVFDFDPLCSDKEDANEYIDDIMPADIQDPDISLMHTTLALKAENLGRGRYQRSLHLDTSYSRMTFPLTTISVVCLISTKRLAVAININIECLHVVWIFLWYVCVLHLLRWLLTVV